MSTCHDPALFLNRELSWLEFNRRVLALARDAEIPLLERVRYLAIFARNLDEFFMVRVAGLKRQVAAGVTERSVDGRTPHEQLRAISERLRPMTAAASACLHEQLLPLLARSCRPVCWYDDLGAPAQAALDTYFEEAIFPVVTPLAVEPTQPFPYISGLSLSLGVSLRDPAGERWRMARLQIPNVLPRFIPVAGMRARAGEPRAVVPLEQLITAHLPRLFPGMQIGACAAFRVTRSADLALAEEEADDLLLVIEQELRRRRFGAVTRLEVAESLPDHILGVLQRELGVTAQDTFRVSGLLDHTALGELADDDDDPGQRWPAWRPITHRRFARAASSDTLFAEIRRGDVLVQHPYERFGTSVERFVAAACEDPQVLAIKQTLYRPSDDSPIVRALIRAAERGKQVVALVELRARFDEETNILWARALERAGVQVVYGVAGLKTHAKTTLVVRREGDRLRRYAHIGSGNYNPATARTYTDLGLFTCDDEIGADLSDLFNFLTGAARQESLRALVVAPDELRAQLCRCIQGQIDRQRATGDGRIRCKLNALTDRVLIAELYRAAQAGVPVELIVRGVCGLRPGIPGVSAGIRVVSIVGRMLEHERICEFGDELWIGSADWMPRNLDRRVELLVPVRDAELCAQLRTVLDEGLADNVHGWELAADGSWSRRRPGPGEPVCASQAELMAAALRRNA